MTVGEMKAMIDQIAELHGSEARVHFVFQRASGRVGIGDITSYTVMMGSNAGNTVRFAIDYPRGKEDG